MLAALAIEKVLAARPYEEVPAAPFETQSKRADEERKAKSQISGNDYTGQELRESCEGETDGFEKIEP